MKKFYKKNRKRSSSNVFFFLENMIFHKNTLSEDWWKIKFFHTEKGNILNICKRSFMNLSLYMNDLIYCVKQFFSLHKWWNLFKATWLLSAELEFNPTLFSNWLRKCVLVSIHDSKVNIIFCLGKKISIFFVFFPVTLNYLVKV